jgi:hypothetical protein
MHIFYSHKITHLPIMFPSSLTLSRLQVDFGFSKFIRPGSKTFTFAGTPEVREKQLETTKIDMMFLNFFLSLFFFTLHPVCCPRNYLEQRPRPERRLLELGYECAALLFMTVIVELFSLSSHTLHVQTVTATQAFWCTSC